MVREAAYLRARSTAATVVGERMRGEGCTGARKGRRGARRRACACLRGSASGHYASLGNLANDSIETGGMSSMWT